MHWKLQNFDKNIEDTNEWKESAFSGTGKINIV